MARIASALLALTACAGLAGCAYPGYGGVSVGYGSGGYYDDYGYYGAPYYGWYDGYYYPGAGYYIYDRGGHRHKWNDHHRRYWEGRGRGRDGREHWGDYRRDGRDGNGWRDRPDRDERADWQRDRRGDRRGDGRRGEGQGRPDRPDGGRRTYRDVRGPEAYAGNAPTQAAPAQSATAPAVAAPTRSRPEGARGAGWRGQREQRSTSGDQPRASRGDGGRQPQGSRGDGPRGGRGGRGPQG